MRIVQRYYSSALRSLHREGVLFTARHAVEFICRKPLELYREWRFDRKWGVKTIGYVPLPEESSPSFVDYTPTPLKKFQEIMESVSPHLSSPVVFCDIGSGLGRVLLMAAEYSFRRIVGIEFNPEFSRTAQENVDRFLLAHGSSVEIDVVCSDAAKYVFPDEDALLYFYNPFKKDIMLTVLDNIRKSAVNTKQRYIIYYNPVLAPLLSDPKQFTLLVRKPDYAFYRMIID